MSIEAKRRGRKAEERVYNIALDLGLDVRYASEKEDGAQKADIFIKGIPLQVSCNPKSKKQRRLLGRRGIVSIAAGDSYADELVLRQILNVLG